MQRTKFKKFERNKFKKCKELNSWNIVKLKKQILFLDLIRIW